MNHVATQKFETLLQQLSEAEQLDLIAYVAAKLKNQKTARSHLDLAGYLSGKVQADFDIDAALNELRGEWLKERRRASQNDTTLGVKLFCMTPLSPAWAG